jgi:hypothetical protein
MAVILKPKRSGTASSVPALGSLADGELAINYTDKKYYMRVGGAVIDITPITSGGGQPADAGLTSISALIGSGYIKASATDTYSLVSSIPQADIANLTSDLSNKADRTSPDFIDDITVSGIATSTVRFTDEGSILRGELSTHNTGNEMHLVYRDVFGSPVGTLVFGAAGALTYNGNPVMTGTLDATLIALGNTDWALNSVPLATGANTVAQTAFGANTFLGRSSAGNLAAKPITDAGFANLQNAVGQTTYTPVISGGTTAGVGTYTTQTGKYYRIGTICFFKATVTWTAHTGTGTIRISLPLTAISDGMDTPLAVGIINNYVSVASSQILADVLAGTATARLLQTPVAGNGTTSGITLDTAASVTIAGFYFV